MRLIRSNLSIALWTLKLPLASEKNSHRKYFAMKQKNSFFFANVFKKIYSSNKKETYSAGLYAPTE